MNRRIVPPPLSEHAIIAIVATAGPVNMETLQHGIAELFQAGFQVKTSPSAMVPPELRPEKYLAASDHQRSKDLIAALCSNECDAVMVTRGGYGTTRILDSIPYKSIKPRWFTGFSDLTALSLALYERRRMITLSGPVVAASGNFSMAGVTAQTWLHWVRTGTPVSYNVTSVRAGKAHGVLLGGCLSLIVALLGTKYSPTYQNAVLLLEDVGEDPYRIDRMLTHCAMNGIFKRVGGVLIGQFCDADGTIREDVNQFVAKRVLELVGHRRIPIVTDFPYGHFRDRVTVPIGCDIDMDHKQIRLSLPEYHS